ncbi:hypothetical protein XI03_01445, partial [Bradyrhizobium sp. CCBAU 65884]|nr:hypothetical protein [Bradyrhizobium sp. CCBAU 65884]
MVVDTEMRLLVFPWLAQLNASMGLPVVSALLTVNTAYSAPVRPPLFSEKVPDVGLVRYPNHSTEGDVAPPFCGQLDDQFEVKVTLAPFCVAVGVKPPPMEIITISTWFVPEGTVYEKASVEPDPGDAWGVMLSVSARVG